LGTAVYTGNSKQKAKEQLPHIGWCGRKIYMKEKGVKTGAIWSSCFVGADSRKYPGVFFCIRLCFGR
jgi:hypothetical protein